MISLLIFPFFYIRQVLLGAFRIAFDVLRPNPRLDPTFLKVPISLKSPRQRLLLANLVSMTPGTLSIDEIENGEFLLVHSLYAGSDPEAEIRSIKDKFETIVARLPI